mmetsp:Transcript_23989/g.33634  ORF Transcript_23989/g.33634 Transcript_23989/m.33634 type:complete len:182 (+) Transcript_23989:138-683(+)
MSHYFPQEKLFEHEKAQLQGINFFSTKESMLRQSWELLKQTSFLQHDQLQNFHYDTYCNLIGLIDMNGANVEALPLAEDRKQLKKQLSCDDDSVPYVSGTAIFKLHSCLNHSCLPNAEVVGGLVDRNDATIKVVALKPIRKGEEVLISYIENPELKSRDERRKELKGCYLFDCNCQACQKS